MSAKDSSATNTWRFVRVGTPTLATLQERMPVIHMVQSICADFLVR
jgi:hypothetical protein